MNLLALLAGVIAAPVATGGVFADAARRDLSRRARRRWTLGVAAVTGGGFLVAAVFGDALARAYLRGVKPAPVLTAPYELTALHLAAGATPGALAVLAYAVGTRAGVRGSLPG